MKKISTILGLLTCSLVSFGQIQTSLGFKGGVAMSEYNGKSMSNTKTKMGPSIGGFANVGFADAVQLQLEMLYSQVGGEYTFNENSYNSTLSYLEFPLLIKVRIPLGGSIYPYGYIGESASFKLNETTNQTAGLGVGDNEIVPVGNNFTASNLSTIVGGGIDLQSQFVLLSLDLRYGMGMINILDAAGSSESRRFTVSIGVGFKISKEEETAATN